MNSNNFIIVVLFFLFFVCLPVLGKAPFISDFIPPAGSAIGPGRNGPWNSRLMTAVSHDGITFTPTGKKVTDQADVPDMAVDSKGHIYLYYTGWNVGVLKNSTAVAISRNNGKSWTFKYVKLHGFNSMASPVDPDIQITKDFKFRLFLTSEADRDGSPSTYLAESVDGIQFKKIGRVYHQNERAVLDPCVFQSEKGWLLFAGGNTQLKGANFLAFSGDGILFSSLSEVQLIKDGLTHAAANVIPVDGGYRLYAFAHDRRGSKGLSSFFSEDGRVWKPEPGIRLEPGKFAISKDIRDPAVIKLGNDSFLMVYVSPIS